MEVDMDREQLQNFNEMARRVNALSDLEIEELIKKDACPFEPEWLIGEPMGQFHCMVCGEMVLAGLPHPRYKTADYSEVLS